MFLRLFLLLISFNVLGQDQDIEKMYFNTLDEVKKAYTLDSASLNRFYSRIYKKDNPQKTKRAIDRMHNLLNTKTQTEYQQIRKEIIPLMKEINSSEHITCTMAEKFANQYSRFDYYCGESLFNDFITTEENYELVWGTFKSLSSQKTNDTCLIHALIKLDNNIRTNVELAETISEFKIEAIQNNPKGYLDMYAKRNENERIKFIWHLFYFDDPNEELLETYKLISENAAIEDYRNIASDVVKKINNNAP